MPDLYTLDDARQELYRRACLANGHRWADDRQADGSIGLVYCANLCGIEFQLPQRMWPPKPTPTLVTEEG